MSSDRLPDIHQPQSERPREEAPRSRVLYAMAYESYTAPESLAEGPQADSFAVACGPTGELRDVLEVVPDHPSPHRAADAVIVRYNLDGTDEVIYRWSDEKRSWIKGGSRGPANVGRKR